MQNPVQKYYRLKKVTRCGCGKNGEHYSEKVMECVVPGTPDKVYTLLFASAFMKTFMREEQKLIGELQGSYHTFAS